MVGVRQRFRLYSLPGLIERPWKTGKRNGEELRDPSSLCFKKQGKITGARRDVKAGFKE